MRPEIVDAARAGISSAAGDPDALRGAITTLLDASIRIEMGSNARRLAVEKYDRTRSVGVLSGYLEEVVDGRVPAENRP